MSWTQLNKCLTKLVGLTLPTALSWAGGPEPALLFLLYTDHGL